MSKQQEELERIFYNIIINEFLHADKEKTLSIKTFVTRLIEREKELAQAILSAGYIKKDEVELDEGEIYELIIMTREIETGIGHSTSLEDHNFVLKLAHAIASSAKAIVK